MRVAVMTTAAGTFVARSGRLSHSLASLAPCALASLACRLASLGMVFAGYTPEDVCYRLVKTEVDETFPEMTIPLLVKNHKQHHGEPWCGILTRRGIGSTFFPSKW